MTGGSLNIDLRTRKGLEYYEWTVMIKGVS